MTAASPPGARPVGRILVIGGGCYGTFYAGQLERAESRGALAPTEVVLVDRDPGCRAARELAPHPRRRLVERDWDAFLDAWLDGRGVEPARAGDVVVPSPLMPHLVYSWLLRRARARWRSRTVETVPLVEPVGTPYDTMAPDGTRYVSWADWLCPTHCVEPATCPMIRAPRTWEMSETLGDYAGRLGVLGPALCVTRHLAYGVGVFEVAEMLAADRLVAEAGREGGAAQVLVGTVSACHGAMNLLGLHAA